MVVKPTLNSRYSTPTMRNVPGTPGPLPNANAAGVTPTTAVSGAAAATTKNTTWATPTASRRSLFGDCPAIDILLFMLTSRPSRQHRVARPHRHDPGGGGMQTAGLTQAPATEPAL